MTKLLPHFESHEAARCFVDGSDLSEYDLSGGKFVRFTRELRCGDG